MNKEELIKEIRRVEDALQRTNSDKLKRDLNYYTRVMKKWQANRI